MYHESYLYFQASPPLFKLEPTGLEAARLEPQGLELVAYSTLTYNLFVFRAASVEPLGR